MASHRRNPSPSPSISSMISDVGSDLSPEEAEVRAYVKKRLMKRMFLGHYQERRYVQNLQLYRDMVVLHKSEVEMKADVDRVLGKLMSFYGDDKWIGITSPDTIGAPAAGHCLWSKLQEVAFGFYWFQISHIRFEDREISVRLKVIRPVLEEVINPSTDHTNFTKSFSDNMDALKSRIRTSIHSLAESQPSSSNSTERSKQASKQGPTEEGGTNQSSNKKSNKSTEEGSENQVPDSTSDTKGSEKKKETSGTEDFMMLLHLIILNWKDILIFLSMALVGAFHGLGKCIHYVGEFSLKFMREMTFLVRTVTPIILAVIELVGKLIGGLYLLIAMMVRGNSNIPARQFMPPIQNRRPQPIQYKQNVRY